MPRALSATPMSALAWALCVSATPAAFAVEPIVVEAESVEPTGAWRLMNDAPEHSGDGYFLWTGNNRYEQAGDGVLIYDVEIEEDGDYFLLVRARRELGGREVADDLENDLWVSVNGDHWIKIFFRGAWDQWVVASRFDFHRLTGLRPDARVHLKAGAQRIYIAGRSENVRFDALAITPAPEDASRAAEIAAEIWPQ